MTTRWYTRFLIAAAALTLAVSFVLNADARGRRSGSDSSKEEGASIEEELSATADRKFYQYYNAALDLMAKEDFLRAKDNLIRAIAVEPEPNPKKRTTGSNFIQYYPYLKLSEAYYRLGDIKNAEDTLRTAEKKNIEPRDLIAGLWQSIISMRSNPVVFLFPVDEKTKRTYVDIKGIAFDYHDITKVMIGDQEAKLTDASKDKDLVNSLPYKPKLGFEPIDTVYFEIKGFPLKLEGENRIRVRATATNPDRRSDVVEVSVFRERTSTEAKPAESK